MDIVLLVSITMIVLTLAAAGGLALEQYLHRKHRQKHAH